MRLTLTLALAFFALATAAPPVNNDGIGMVGGAVSASSETPVKTSPAVSEQTSSTPPPISSSEVVSPPPTSAASPTTSPPVTDISIAPSSTSAISPAQSSSNAPSSSAPSSSSILVTSTSSTQSYSPTSYTPSSSKKLSTSLASSSSIDPSLLPNQGSGGAVGPSGSIIIISASVVGGIVALALVGFVWRKVYRHRHSGWDDEEILHAGRGYSWGPNTAGDPFKSTLDQYHRSN